MNISKNSKNSLHIWLILAAATVLIVVTGLLGSDLLYRAAYGYGGSGFVLQPINAVNNPLVISDPQRNGRLFRHLGTAIVGLEVPSRTTDGYALFDVRALAVTQNNNVCSGAGQIIGGQALTVFATDAENRSIDVFNRDVIVSINIAGLPLAPNRLGVYYLNTNDQWVLGETPTFDEAKSTVVFKIKEAGTFALIDASGLPRLLETAERCAGQVLGEKRFADGAILRTCDAQLYVIEESVAKSIGRLPLRQRTYDGTTVNDVDYETIVQYTPDDQGPKRQKSFSAGDLLRTCDWKIYRVEGETFRHIGSLGELRQRFKGQVINNVDYWQIAKYRNLAYRPTGSTGSQVAGVKRFGAGALLRTPDNNVYVIEENGVRQIATLPSSQTVFAGLKINDVNNDTLSQYRQPTTISSANDPIRGITKYADGTLLRTPDWVLYRVQNGSAGRLDFVPKGGLNTYAGQLIIDIGFSELALYRSVEIGSPTPTSRVLGTKRYADGALVRSPDKRVYIIENGRPRHLATLVELKRYAGTPISNLSLADFQSIQVANQAVTTGGQVLGAKRYGDGTLLKTSDWKVYVISNGQARHIATLPGATDTHEGKKVINVSFEELALYQ